MVSSLLGVHCDLVLGSDRPVLARGPCQIPRSPSRRTRDGNHTQKVVVGRVKPRLCCCLHRYTTPAHIYGRACQVSAPKQTGGTVSCSKISLPPRVPGREITEASPDHVELTDRSQDETVQPRGSRSPTESNGPPPRHTTRYSNGDSLERLNKKLEPEPTSRTQSKLLAGSFFAPVALGSCDPEAAVPSSVRYPVKEGRWVCAHQAAVSKRRARLIRLAFLSTGALMSHEGVSGLASSHSLGFR